MSARAPGRWWHWAPQRWALPAGVAQSPAPAAADGGVRPWHPVCTGCAPRTPVHPPRPPAAPAPGPSTCSAPHAGSSRGSLGLTDTQASSPAPPPALSPPGRPLPGPGTQHRWAPSTWNSPALPVNPGLEGPAGGGAKAKASLKTLPLPPRGAGVLTAPPPTSTGCAACSRERGGGEAKLMSSKLLHVALATGQTGKVEGDTPSVRPAVFGPGSVAKRQLLTD